MIRPDPESDEYLNFICDKCKTRFSHAVEISRNESASELRPISEWRIMRIHLECPQCQQKGEYKLAIMK